MTRQEHLLTIVAEECMEVAQRCTKALRFGLTEIQPGQEQTNAERIMGEFNDLGGAMQLLHQEANLPAPRVEEAEAKIRKIEEFLKYSESVGTLTADESEPTDPDEAFCANCNAFLGTGRNPGELCVRCSGADEWEPAV